MIMQFNALASTIASVVGARANATASVPASLASLPASFAVGAVWKSPSAATHPILETTSTREIIVFIAFFLSIDIGVS
jgi:hypothetical protein